MLFVRDIKLGLDATENDAIEQAISILKVPATSVQTAKVARLSVDARRGKLSLVYTIAIQLENEGAGLSLESLAPCVTFKKQAQLCLENSKILPQSEKMPYRPVVCGFGPSGIFAALLLAKNGYNPIVIERGMPIEDRTKTVEAFNKTGKLDVNSNVQFGEGGAGAFSDGKLTTRIGDPLCDFVTQTFLDYNAPAEIGYLSKPHIGTDLLCDIIKNIRTEIISLGGEVVFNTTLTNIKTKNGKVIAVVTNNGEIPTNHLVLATGHSARDTFDILEKNAVTMVAKPFSVGFRVEHLQTEIDKSLYHNAAGHPALPKGEYQLNCRVADRGVYTFCMCPGGNVVAAATEENKLCVNGMSYHARDGKNANSAVVVGVTEKDFDGDYKKAIEFQQSIETKAFEMGKGDYTAPCQNVGAFIKGEKNLDTSMVQPTYPLGVKKADLGQILPNQLTNALRAGLVDFGKKLRGFDSDKALLTGVETRTSSPVRVLRDDSYQSVSIKGLYPTGEGAGYAGGIMSAAVDGLRVAKQIIEKTCE